MSLLKHVSCLLACGILLIPATMSEGITYILDPYTIETLATDGQNCTKPGKMCDGCEQVSFCVQLPDGTWLKEELYTCPDGLTCFESMDDCTNKPNPKCDSNVVDYKFICHQIGIFPDPFDCTKYHICLPSAAGSITPHPESQEYKCENGYSYDSLSTLCKNKLVNGTCDPFAPACNASGQSGVIPGNPSLYYICLKADGIEVSFPQMFVCPYNQEFNGNNCEDPTPPIGTDDKGRCLKTGNFVDPLSCKSYIECSDEGAVPISRICDIGKKFDHKQQTCVLFTC